MPSVETWWCGDPVQLNHVLCNLDQMLIRPAFRLSDAAPTRAATLSAAQREDLIARIQSQPAMFVGQSLIERSTVPVVDHDNIKPWHLAVRSFLVRRGSRFEVLPGGLARVAQSSEVLDGQTSAGERSQDIWITSDAATPFVSLLPAPGDSIVLRRPGAELPSRVAENLFWVGRYAERTEAAARLLRSMLRQLTNESTDPAAYQGLLRALIEQGQIDPDYLIPELNDSFPPLERMLPVTVFDERTPGSVRAMITGLVNAISKVRDRMSLDAWRAVNRIDIACHLPASGTMIDPSDLLALVDRILLDLLCFAGLSSESVTRTLGWRFLDLGRRLERTSQMTDLLTSALVSATEREPSLLEAILETADSLMTYRSRYLASVQLPAVLDLLLTDETNPRSIMFQLDAIEVHLAALPRDKTLVGLTPEQRTVTEMRHAVRTADVFQLSKGKGGRQRGKLEDLLRLLHAGLPKLANELRDRFLIYAGTPRHFGSTQRTTVHRNEI